MFRRLIETLVGKENYLSKEEDLFELIKEKENQKQKPRLYMWCGTEDFLYEDDLRLNEHR